MRPNQNKQKEVIDQVKSTNKVNSIVVMAPGRTCLFGDHQDYLGLPVIACAIGRHITLSARKNDCSKFVIHKPDIGKKRIIDLDVSFDNLERGDFFMSVLAILRNYECIPDVGYDITISGNIAINAGTSSSSAVIVAWAQFLVAAFGCNTTVTKEFISQIAYEAEVVFYGFPGGKMDQYSIGLGNIIYLETGGALAYKVFEKPLPGLIVAESGIPKETNGVLGDLRKKALLAIHEVKQKNPTFDVSQITKKELPAYLNYVSDDLKTFLAAAVLNHVVTQEALMEFNKPQLDVARIGSLMNEHHAVLRDYLNITLPRIDKMVDAALEAGALGVKIVGSGRGGSIVALAGEGEQPKIIEAIMKAGARDAYAVDVDPGVRITKKQ